MFVGKGFQSAMISSGRCDGGISNVPHVATLRHLIKDVRA
jgi:hypothetical protein